MIDWFLVGVAVSSAEVLGYIAWLLAKERAVARILLERQSAAEAGRLSSPGSARKTAEPKVLSVRARCLELENAIFKHALATHPRSSAADKELWGNVE